ncbi:MAG: type II toxin-antitoxin system death-on-curing family toxin [Chloroflexota bacterium]|nr:type II toxin-antitoxin system death-on-curing family toxin [Chloroflexota bacterium]
MEGTGSPSAHLRDDGRLEAAVMRPRMAAHYERADVIRQCALMAVGISQAQAFVDGNKRTAFAAADVFLRLNGLYISGNPVEMAQQLEHVAEREGRLDEATTEFEQLLRQSVTPLKR